MADDSSRCLGRDPDGDPCICLRVTKTHVVDDRTLCSNCLHIESAHPQPRRPVGSLIREYRDAGRLGSTSKESASNTPKAKATQSEAEAETNSGLKKKRKSGTDTEPPTQGSSKAKVKEEKPSKKVKGENVQLGHVAALVWGTQGKPSNLKLTRSKAPNSRDIDLMRKYKLAVRASPTHPLFLNTAWDTERCDKFFSALFPDLFGHLDRHPPKADPKASPEVQQQKWLGVIKTNQSVALASEELPTGADLADYAKRRGHSASDRVLFIATKIEVPQDRYQDWDVESDSDEPEEEEPFSDFDMLDEDESPQKSTSKSKGKAKASVKTPVKKSTAVKIEKPEPESDMKNAAKMRTRLASETIKWNSIKIPSSSDDGKGEAVVDLVSDDEPDLPDPSTLAASASQSAVTRTQTTPLFTSFIDKSPSQSPEHDLPNVFDDSDFFSVPHSPTGNLSAHSSGWASTSSLASASSQLPVTPLSNLSTTDMSTSSWAAPSLPVSASSGWVSSTSLASEGSAGTSASAGPPQSSGFMKRGGKSKGLSNPWKR
ncbi:hypothetical protein FB451DRAFT_1192699 [Mycena latifolia]|nr:hypothetical protein FB451DRAFT_1192699 [Mycena latifolia]